MGFLQDLAKRAESALASVKAESNKPKVVLSYLGQTVEVDMADIDEGTSVSALIDAHGSDVGLGDVNLSSVGVRKGGSVVSLSEKVSEGTYFLTLAREEKA